MAAYRPLLLKVARWLDHYLITIKQSVSFRRRMHPENFLTYEFKMADNQHYLPR